MDYSDIVLLRAALSKAFRGWSREDIMSLSMRDRLNLFATLNYLDGR